MALYQTPKLVKVKAPELVKIKLTLTVGILNGLARNQTGRRYSNSVAEGNNSMIDKIIDVSNGYKKFKRFRARIMLIMTYNNQNRESK